MPTRHPSLPVLLLLASSVLTGCLVSEQNCAENPESDACQPWICCTAPNTAGCSPTEIARRCSDGGPDAGPNDAAPTDAGDAGSNDAGDAGPVDGGNDAGPCGACPAERPVCDGTTCVQCTAEDAGVCEPAQFCDDTNRCVACRDNEDCDQADAAQCQDGACVPCSDEGHCAHLAGRNLCDSGTCVECTADTEEARCGANTCSRLTRTCTETVRHSRVVCEACEADTDCLIGRRCVQLRFADTDTGYFCFRDDSGGCGDSDATLRPYSTRRVLTSIDGVVQTFCMPPPTTTCEGIGDRLDKPCSMDSDCGMSGLDDGFCPPSTPGPGTRLCSYLCVGGIDCAGGNCGDSPRHCL